MWNIHGKLYDLHPFLSKHPGGKSILEACKGDDDLTATFESYHAFCDMEKIKNIMKKYEIKTSPTNISSKIPSFEKHGFYRTLQKKVRHRLKDYTKINRQWMFKIIVQCFVFISSFIIGFYLHNINIIIRLLCAIVSGHTFVQIGFCAMHDASHMALFNPTHYNYINEFISNLWNSIALWDSQMWIQHHVIRHHTFTGDYNKDPDIIHFKPFIRKSDKISGKYWNYSKKYNTIISLFTICIFPGMFVGQGILYNYVWLTKKRLWKMNLSSLFSISIWQSLVKLCIIYSFVQSKNILIVFGYLISQNISYAMCILPDHDTFETNQNHVQYDSSKDWGEIQVRNSGNFCNQNNWVCFLYGGINYQIEHHLFPTLCHVHFYKIKPIVKQTCDEFGIPYVHHTSLFNAIKSSLKQYSSN